MLPFLNSGVILAILQSSGNVVVLMERFIICVSGFTIEAHPSLRKIDDMSSNPGDLFNSRSLIKSLTVFSETLENSNSDFISYRNMETLQYLFPIL